MEMVFMLVAITLLTAVIRYTIRQISSVSAIVIDGSQVQDPAFDFLLDAFEKYICYTHL